MIPPEHFMVFTDIQLWKRYYQRGAECWVERSPEGPGSHRCMPTATGGFVHEKLVYELCERTR